MWRRVPPLGRPGNALHVALSPAFCLDMFQMTKFIYDDSASESQFVLLIPDVLCLCFLFPVSVIFLFPLALPLACMD